MATQTYSVTATPSQLLRGATFRLSELCLLRFSLLGRLFVSVWIRHAGVYTPEEVALITREKLIRLQSLYINQFKRLQHLMKEKRRQFLVASKHEMETIGKSLSHLPTSPLPPTRVNIPLHSYLVKGILAGYESKGLWAL